jgi:neutral ceramidase
MRFPSALVAVLLVATAAPAAGPLSAGSAVVDITPPLGYPMWGYGDRKAAACAGVLDPLKARALVLAVGDDRFALVSLDLGRAPPRASTDAIRARVKKEANVSQVFLCGSHTHHGPVIEIDDWPTRETSYVHALEEKLAGAIVEAAKALRPARIGVAVKEVPFNRNRHSQRPGHPVDRELRVLRVEGVDGKPIALAVNFAAHATMTDSHVLKFSADWPGAMAALVEKETGAPCLFLQGAAGDMSANPPKDVHGPVEFGKTVGRAALELSAGIHCDSPEKATYASAEDDFSFPLRIDLGNPAINTMILSRAFFPALLASYEREYRSGVRPHLSTAVLDGNIGFVGVSGEFFCGHSLSLKQRARLDHLFFVGYCNDYQQYFPTIEAASEGGYGTTPLESPAEIGAGEQVMNRALLRLYRLRGKLPEATPLKGD